jgi:hypothetical protein
MYGEEYLVRQKAKFDTPFSTPTEPVKIGEVVQGANEVLQALENQILGLEGYVRKSAGSIDDSKWAHQMPTSMPRELLLELALLDKVGQANFQNLQAMCKLTLTHFSHDQKLNHVIHQP